MMLARYVFAQRKKFAEISREHRRTIRDLYFAMPCYIRRLHSQKNGQATVLRAIEIQRRHACSLLHRHPRSKLCRGC